MATLRETAAALGVSRKKLLRWIAEGLPVTRRGERVSVDIDEARAWVALNDFGDQRTRRAAVLDPADPRYRERKAAAELKRIESALEFRHAMRRDDAVDAYKAAIIEFRKLLLQAIDATNLQDLGPHLSVACDALVVEWPIPAPLPENPDEPDSPDEPFDLLPIPPASDPRYQFALAAAEQKEAKLAELHHVLITPEIARQIADEHFATIRARVAKIPDALARRIAKHGDEHFRVLLDHEIQCALADLSETPRPKLRLESESEAPPVFEDVDGACILKNSRPIFENRGK